MAARVLIIEDNQANMDLMSYLLNAFGHVPLCAFDGVQGVETALRERPDLVICDIHLPRLDGYGVVGRLKADPATMSIPVLAASALPVTDGGAALRAAGFDGHLPKSLEPDTLIPSLERYLPAALRSTRSVPAVDHEQPRPQEQGRSHAREHTTFPPDSLCAVDAAHGGGALAAGAGEGSAPRARILLLDAAPDDCGLVASVLAHFGYALKVAVSSEQAVYCARQQFDLILCDIDTAQPRHAAFLPEALRHWPGVPLVLIRSAQEDPVDALLPPGTRPALVLAHPLEPQQLADALQQCLDMLAAPPPA